MADQSLQIVKSLFDKLISGTEVSPADIQALIFDKNFKLPTGFLTSGDFIQILRCFDFNNDMKTDMMDFQFLKDHMSDLSVFLKLTRVSTLATAKFSTLSNVKLSPTETLDTVIRIILYCVLYISASNSVSFRQWASMKTQGGIGTNADVLFELLSDLILYIKTSDQVSSSVNQALQFFKNKCGCSCISDNENTMATKAVQAKVEMNSLVTQISKEAKIQKLSKN
jgi:hypothetical protein